jgi:hypothetical protein
MAAAGKVEQCEAHGSAKRLKNPGHDMSRNRDISGNLNNIL